MPPGKEAFSVISKLAHNYWAQQYLRYQCLLQDKEQMSFMDLPAAGALTVFRVVGRRRRSKIQLVL